MKKTFFPEEFKEKYRELLGKDYEEFMKYSKKKIGKSIWVNSLKIKPTELQEKLEGKARLVKLPFHENAFMIEEIDRPGSLEEFTQGLFNIQEKSAMLPAIALKPEGCEKVLDLTAAPGSKTIQLATLMQGEGNILAIEKNVQRFRSLRFNANKFGLENVETVRTDALKLDKKDYFDAVLLDSPCSSEGLVRKKRDALKNWSHGLVKRKAKLQKKLIVRGFDALKKGKAMVYSTCSLSPEENEEVVEHLLEKRKAVIEEVNIKGFKLRKGIRETGYRVMPQDNDSQAFYFCKIKKE